MKHKWIRTLTISATLVAATPYIGLAQNTLGSEGGAVIPGKVAPTVPPNAEAGSPGSEPETSLSTRSAADPATREGDVPHQIAILLPYGIVVAIILVGGLYFFVFRRSSTTESDATNTEAHNS